MSNSIAASLLPNLKPIQQTPAPIPPIAPVPPVIEADQLTRLLEPQTDGAAETPSVSNGNGNNTVPQQIEPVVVVSEATPTQIVPPMPPANDENSVMHLLLDTLVIDPRQPRKFLPTDIRADITHGITDPRTAMKTLIERASKGDQVATTYLESLQALARVIREVGLPQPICVSLEHNKGGQTLFRIVDGERRYWAYVWMEVVRVATQLDAQQVRVPALLYKSDASADDIQRAQWAVNIFREDIPAVDYAEAIWQIREDYFSRLAIDRQRYITELGADADGLSLAEIAALLTLREVERLTSRRIKRSSLYLYLSVAEKLKANAKSLARAHSIALRQLGVVVRLPEAQQIEMILRMIESNKVDEPIKSQPTASLCMPGQPGRPSSLQRGINVCLNLVGALQKISDKALARNAPEDKQAFLAELNTAAVEIDRARKLIKTQLSA